ncbi:MAG: SusC/RagA family TonB-linked outer membrane protein [Chitinophagaceae bacterium]
MKVKQLLIALAILMTIISYAQAQLNEISGTVTSEDGETLSGASITARGSKNAVITDANGQFRISVPSGTTTLSVSYVGYETAEFAIGGKSVINASLKRSARDLENVVVSVLGFRERGDKLGSSVSRIATKEVLSSGETGLLQGMAGKASGVTITRSTGDPGAGSNIKIRGANTITGAAGPLIIVDGIPISNSALNGFGSDAAGTGVVQQSRLNDINPNDIESLQILKGAAAASLWGSRAANGVIVITTKKGRAGALKISYTSTYSVDEINSRHPMQTTYGQGLNGVYNPIQANSWGDKIANRSGVPDSVAGTAYFLGTVTGRKYLRITRKNEKQTFSDKNFDGVFGKGHYWQNALSLSGGNDKSRFFFSLENLTQKGIIRANSDYIRNSVRLNSDHTLGKYLKFSNKAAYINIKSNRIQNNSNTAGLYLGLLRTPPDFDNIDYIGTYVDANGVEARNRHRSYRRYLGDNVQPTYNNPYWTIFRQESPSKVDRFLVSSEISSNPFSWLELILRAGIDANYDNRRYFFPVGSAGERSPGSYREEKISEVEKNIDLIARASKEIKKDLNATFILGGNINDRQREQLYGESSSFLDNVNLQNFILTPDAGTHIINYFLQRGSNRGYSTLGLDYGNQLFVNIGGALEASSTISKSFFYPSADVAWQFDKLSQLENAAWLSFGKVRAAWGKVGVQPTAYNFVTVYEGARYDAYDDGLALTNFGGGFRLDNSKGNANLKPEVKTEWEIGADLRFLEDRFSLSMSYYRNKIIDILLNVGLPPSGGFTSQYTNAATMENKGFETDVRLGIVKSKSLDVQLFGNYNQNRNKVLSLRGSSSVDLSTQSVSSRAVEGYQLGVLWGPRALRDAKGGYALDANGFPLVDLAQGVIGDPNPDWRGAAGLTATYKGFDFNVLFETFQGGDISQGTKSVLYNFGTHADVGRDITLTKDLKNVNGQMFPAGTTLRANIGNFGGGDVLMDQAWYTSRGAGLGASAIREFFVGDASWTRLRELSLGYTLKSTGFTKATRFNSIKFSITGRNLVLWTDIIGFDPEVNQTGVNNGFGTEYFTNPSTRSYLFTITLN